MVEVSKNDISLSKFSSIHHTIRGTPNQQLNHQLYFDELESPIFNDLDILL